MRRKKHREERLQACSDYMLKEVCFNDVYLEIGCGKGDFITCLAEREPENNFIAFEKNADVALLAMEKAKSKNLKNVKFFIGDIKPFLEEADKSSCKGIYINFCDPWEKEGYRKRRLTHQVFLDLYRKILENGAKIQFKTDNRKLFQFSLNSFLENGYMLKNISLDLHKDNYEENIVTEYERLFSEQGFPIFRLEAFPIS